MSWLTRVAAGSVWRWLATRAASFWIMAVCGVVLATGVGYIQQLRVAAAECRGQANVRAQIDELTNQVARGIEKDTDENIRNIRQAPDVCLSERMPDAVLDSLRAPSD